MKQIFLVICLALFTVSCNKTENPIDVVIPESTLSATFEVEILDITNSSLFLNSSFTLVESEESVIRYGAVYSEHSHFNPNKVQSSLGELQEGEPFAVELTGLKENTTYYVKIYIESKDGDIAYSETQTYKTLSTEIVDRSEVAFDINVNEVSDSKATINISYDLIGEDVLSFNAQKTGLLISENESLSPNEIFSIALTPRLYLGELNSETTYYFKVFIEDGLGNRLFSEVHNFTTLKYSAPEPQSSIEVFFNDLSYYTCPEEDLWIIQDEEIVDTSVSASFGGLRDALSSARSDDRNVWLEFANLSSMPETTSFNPFYSTRNILSISLPKATYIGTATFRLSDDLTSVSIPMATEIGEGAFMQCESLTAIEVNPEYFTFEDGALYDKDKTALHTYLYSNAPADYTAPASVTTVLKSAFNCTSVTGITLPNATNVEDSAMNHCDKLTSASMPKAEELGGYVFNNCTSLTSISAPRVKRIGKKTFEGCNQSCEIALATESDIESIETFSTDSMSFYKATLTIGKQNSKWVDEDCLIDNDNVKYKFKQIILE